ncbi:MAG: ATP-binding protein [Nanoarchaeota archaeon]
MSIDRIVMPAEVNTISIAGLFEYGTARMGDQAIDLFLEGIDLERFDVRDRLMEDTSKPLELDHLITPGHWISNQLSLMIFLNAGRYLPGERPLFEAGKYAARHNPRIRERINVLKLASPKKLFSRAVKENPKYNRTKELDLKVDDKKVTLYVSYFPNISRLPDGRYVIEEICDWGLGIYTVYAEVTGFKGIQAREVECISDGYKKCVFEVSWDKLPWRRRFANFVVGKFLPHIVEDYEKVIAQLDQITFRLRKEVDEQTGQLIATERIAATRTAQVSTAKMIGRGLAHEIGNALSPAAIQMSIISAIPDSQSTIDALTESGSQLDRATTLLGKRIFELEQYGIPTEIIYNGMVPLLQGIANHTGTILSKVSSIGQAAEQRELALSEISKGVNRGLALAKEFLAYAKAGEIVRGTDKINLVDVVDNISSTYATELKNSGIEYVTNLNDSDLTLQGEYLQLETIIKNLVLNAKDAVKDDGRIIVSVDRYSDEKKPYIQLTVQDNGEGIPKEDQEKIFEPFFSTKGNKGTGLGLSYLRRIIEAYDGKIECESEVGKGATFKVYLPLKL